MVGVDDLCDVGVGQLAVDAVDQGAEFAGVDEQGLLCDRASIGGALVQRLRLLFFVRNQRQTGICVL